MEHEATRPISHWPPAVRVAQARYDGAPRDFWADLRQHLEHGVVASTPGMFLMARPVKREAPRDLLANIAWVPQDADTWLVWSAAGPLAALLALMPYPLPWIAFHRRRNPRLRVYALANFQRRIR